ncbi:hypothetical protein KW795_01715 [Candidatus Microgenomates bacterium]|nr:hypothetical protein [Candidatus Microgenomates bacterium]
MVENKVILSASDREIIKHATRLMNATNVVNVLIGFVGEEAVDKFRIKRGLLADRETGKIVGVSWTIATPEPGMSDLEWGFKINMTKKGILSVKSLGSDFIKKVDPQNWTEDDQHELSHQLKEAAQHPMLMVAR